VTNGQTKIYQLYPRHIVLIDEQDVFWFDISVDDVVFMQVGHGFDQGADDRDRCGLVEAGRHCTGVPLAELGSLHDLIEELSAAAHLRDDVHTLAVLVDVSKLDDARVVDFREEVNLASYPILSPDAGFVNRLDSARLPRRAVDAGTDFARHSTAR